MPASALAARQPTLTEREAITAALPTAFKRYPVGCVFLRLAVSNSGHTCTNVGTFPTDANGMPLYQYFLNFDANDGRPTNPGCISLAPNGTCLVNGVKVQLYDCNGTGAQQWRVQGASLVNPESGRCLDDPGSTLTNGTQLQIWECNNTNAQHWALP